ncbi:hypothetical protein SLS58_000180 [Diplodia intermedia]|uniref:Retrotransposon gag domain-containing protein n=1 Tax=Diplodia intermedia TaxID=856260 RepID=A0ABR3U6L2_9PEZI
MAQSYHVRLPVFHGKPDEDSRSWVVHCKLRVADIVQAYTDQDERRLAELILLEDNLGGDALAWFSELEEEHKRHLETCLVVSLVRFPKDESHFQMQALQKYAVVAQGKLSLDEYTTKARASEEDGALIERNLSHLSDKMAGRVAMELYKAEVRSGRSISFDKAAQIAKDSHIEVNGRTNPFKSQAERD